MASATFRQRDIMRTSITMTVTVHRPPHHRLLFWAGMRMLIVGAWIAGFAGTRIDREYGTTAPPTPGDGTEGTA